MTTKNILQMNPTRTFGLAFLLLTVAGTSFCGPGVHVPNPLAGNLTYMLALAVVQMPLFASLLWLLQSLAGQWPERKIAYLWWGSAVLIAALVCNQAAIFFHSVLFSHSDTHNLDNWIKGFVYYFIAFAFLTKNAVIPKRTAETRKTKSPTFILPVKTTPAIEDKSLIYVEADDRQVKLVYKDGIKYGKSKFNEVIGLIEIQGRQVHKSFWVACHAVKTTRRIGRNLFVELEGGFQVPVGRKFEKQTLIDYRDHNCRSD